jgi:signal transduction histidine kinase
MRAQLGRLQRLITDLREVARAEEGALGVRQTTLDVAELVDAAVRAAAPRYSAKGVTLNAVHPSTIPPITGDYDRLQQVLANVLDNALRHTPSGGTVIVQADPPASGRTGTVALSVTDNGDGIPLSELDTIFDRLHRVDPARRGHDGLGLGLTIARAIVEAHHGAIAAASRGPGTGARFTIVLPAGVGVDRSALVGGVRAL